MFQKSGKVLKAQKNSVSLSILKTLLGYFVSWVIDAVTFPIILTSFHRSTFYFFFETVGASFGDDSLSSDADFTNFGIKVRYATDLHHK